MVVILSGCGTLLMLTCTGGLNPPNAIAAHFRCKGRLVPCLPGTRVKVLEEVFQWISCTECAWDEHRPMPSDSPSLGRCVESPCIFWLNGLAGSGKTTIAFTCAEHCQDKGILAANFFCSRDNADCSNIKLIFTTIAYQMGKFCAEFKVVLSDTLRSDPEIVYSDVSYQLQQLIVEPLLAVGEKFPRSVVVIDALDECKDDNATSTILASLSQYIDKLFPLQFLITSRPIHKITRGFQNPHLSCATRPLILHQVDLDVIESDIQYYLEQHFDEIKDQYYIPAPWPSSADIETLTHMSSGLFIFAATAVRFIGMADPGDPMAQLEVLLQKNPVAGTSPQQHLDQLYSQVLKSTFPNMSDQLAAKLHLILGTVALLQDPLPLDQLEDLIGYRIYHHLQLLQSIMTVPADVGVVQLIHPSFFDFIVDHNRCQEVQALQFRVNPQLQHTILAKKCLNLMTRLKKDICGIGDPTKFNHEVPGLSEKVSKNISCSLEYACRHWGLHLCSGLLSSDLWQLLKDFCLKYLVNWIEVCSLLGYLKDAVQMLVAVQRCLKVCAWFEALR